MRLALLVPPILITLFMVFALATVVVFENRVSPSAQALIAEQEIGAKATPFLDMSTGGNLVFSFGAFLLVTLFADLVLLVPLYLLDRRARRR
ncbi:MAG: hypothetical protein JRN23_02140 [Nitrososphaerota archaeon]|nr:hypothetical protein [Nitrososphaerota archaeon]MDG6978804.1 hypothetical protein [Nitrososphaerota archaeon]MDG7020715.1 hypothetical protein [Nitrososphaerota archaeon]